MRNKRLTCFFACLWRVLLLALPARAAEFEIVDVLRVDGYTIMQSSVDVAGNRFAVGGSTLSAQYGKVGIGTSTPSFLLQISSAPGAGGDLLVISTGASNIIRMTGSGEIFANKFYGDISGATGLPSGDNLGNHTATMALDMASKDIVNVSTLSISSITTAAAGVTFSSNVFITKGMLGLGTANPQRQLHAYSGTGAAVVLVEGHSTTSNVELQMRDTTTGHYWNFTNDGRGTSGFDTDNPSLAFWHYNGSWNNPFFIDGVTEAVHSKRATAINATVPANASGFGYRALWFPNSTSIMPEDNSSYAQIALASNLVRTAGGWAHVDAARPTWQLSVGHGTNIDNLSLVRTPAGGDANNPVSLLRVTGTGNVGIGTVDPGARLEVAGQVKITGGTPGPGKVLISDAVGLASWATPTGDNLGNHTATQGLDMAQFPVINVSSVAMLGDGIRIATSVYAGASGIFISTSGAIITLGGGSGTVKPNARGIGAVDLQTYRTSASSVAAGAYSVVSGGRDNRAGDIYATVAGGRNSTASGIYSTVSGGYLNAATNDYSTASGGTGNLATGLYSTVAGGSSNKATGLQATASGGYYNYAWGDYSVVSGGSSNYANADFAAVSGGYSNLASFGYSSVGGGDDNIAGALYSAITGGRENSASGDYSAVSGGYLNIAGGSYANVTGGYSNKAVGYRATVTGGSGNTALGQYSWAAGRISSSTAAGTFTWADSRGFQVRNAAVNRTLFKNEGGFMIVGSTISGSSILPDNLAMLEVVSTGTTVNDYAQVWRDSDGTVVASMTATGVLYPQSTPAGDNLGNHTATQELQMGAYGVYTSSNITAARYLINGSTVLAVLPGNSSLAVGRGAGRVNTGDFNLFVGDQAGNVNAGGAYNTAAGYAALTDNVSGNYNTAHGYNTLRYSNGGNNTAIGANALQSNTSGGSNTAVGRDALYFNTSAPYNVAMGRDAAYYNVTGGSNTVVGYQAGYGANGNSYEANSMFGYRAGYGLTTGSDNIFLGWQAGYATTSGVQNIVLGYDQRTSAPTASNELNLGGVLFGKLDSKTIGISTRSPQAALDVVSTATAANVYAQLWRNGGGVVVASMTSQGALQTGTLEVSGAAVFSAEYNNGNSGTAATITWDNGSKQFLTLTGNATLTFSAPAGKAGSFVLRLAQDGTGGRAVTWPASVKWRGGVAPNLSTAASAVDIVTFYYSGSNYYGCASTGYQ